MPSYLTDPKQSFVPTNLYTPNFDAIGGMLNIKQRQYDSGFNQIKSAYNSILNAPLTNQDNQDVRKQYLADANNQLKNLPTADLSLNQNIAKSMDVFKSFEEDDDIISDIVKTKGMQSQMEFANRLRNSKDPQEQAQYWDMGAAYINNGLDRLRTAKRGDGSIQRVENRRYVSYFDSEVYLDDAAKKEGLKIERETSKGPVKLTRINGDDAVPLFETWAKSKLGNNPHAMDNFRVTGTVLYENKVRNLMNEQGFDEETAKAALATNYLDSQATKYKDTVDALNGQLSTLTTKMDNLKKSWVPSVENAEKLTAYVQEIADIRDNQIPKYQPLADKFSNKNSKEYQDAYRGITSNGESFFAEHQLGNFITGWARGRASNSSVKYDIDPLAKENLSLEKEMMRLNNQKSIADENNEVKLAIKGMGQGGTGTGAGKSAAEANTPVPIGLNTKGIDPVTSYNRFVQAKDESLKAHIDNGFGFIEQMNLNYADIKNQVSNKYLANLRDQMLNDGKTTKVDPPEILAEHKRLQEAGVIPADINLGAGPIRIYNAIKSHYYDLFKTQAEQGLAKPNIADNLKAEAYYQDQYTVLKEADDKAIQQLKKDPAIADIFSNNHIVTYDQFVKSKGVDTSDKAIKRDYDVYLRGERLTPGSTLTMGTDGHMTYEQYKTQYLKGVDYQYKTAYDSKVNRFKEAYGKTTLDHIEERYIAPGVHFDAGKENDQTTAKKIATIAVNDLADQSIDKDGVGPINIDQLVALGADKEEVNGLLQMLKGSIDKYISGVNVTKIGADGNPSVRIQIDPDRLMTFMKDGKNNLISKETARALGGEGFEISIKNPNALLSQGINLNFTPATIDQMKLNKDGKVEAPQILKDLGFNYIIEKTLDGKNLTVKFNYQKWDNARGAMVPNVHTETIPVDASSVHDLTDNLFNTAMEIYQGSAVGKTNYYKQNPQISSTFVEDLMKKYNIK